MPNPNKDSMSSNHDTKPKKKKRNGKLDIPTIIFFGLLVVGLIVLTIIILKKPSSKIYSKKYGDNIETLVEVYKNGDIDLSVSVDGDRTLQQGTYKSIDDSSNDGYNGEYEATFEEINTTIKVKMVIKDDTLTLTYDDGTTIDFKERKK